MWSNLQAAVPRDDFELRFLADSLPDMWLWQEELPVLLPSIPRPTPDGNVGRAIRAC